MNGRWWALAIPLLLLLAVPGAGASGSHYVPRAGDGFHFFENIELTNGVGNYTGYAESTFINGSTTVTAVQPNGTESASFAHAGSFRNNTGYSSSWNTAGTFTFSSVTFHYVQGTDNQTGYTNPYVWFYMDNTLGPGASFYLLNTGFTLLSTGFSYPLAGSPTGYVSTLFAQGSGSFQRNDIYGTFTASYTWQAYFDPATGYIVGYLYSEQDSDGVGDGFTMTDTLSVTSTTYPLTSASAPSENPGTTLSLWVLIGVALVALVIVLLIVVLVLRARSRSRTLPQHGAQGTVAYSPAGMPPPPPGVPPPLHLTPMDQPAVQQIVVKETVKVNCRYCGTLIDSTDTVCPKCGAPRT